MKTAQLIIFPSEPGLISQSCREKSRPHSFRAVLIYVVTMFAICQTLELQAQQRPRPGTECKRLQHRGAETSTGASRLPRLEQVNSTRPL